MSTEEGPPDLSNLEIVRRLVILHNGKVNADGTVTMAVSDLHQMIMSGLVEALACGSNDG